MRVKSAPKRGQHAANEGSAPQTGGTGAWRLPSGLELAEFALQGGFLMPALMEAAEQRQESTPAAVKPEATAVGEQR